VHIGKAIKRNFVEGALVLAGIVILLVQFAIAKYELSDGGTDHTTTIGAPLDDTYIHTRFAENLFHGNGYSFNPGHIVSADTSPLWVVLIGVGGFFNEHLDLVAIILSAIAWLLLAPGVYRISRYVFVWERSFSIAAAICVLLSPRLLAMNLSGMETTFAALLVLVAIEMHIRSREMRQIRMREAVVLALGIALRPEFYLLVLIVFIDWLYLILKKQVSIKKIVPFIIPILVSAFFVFRIPLSERGSLLYHSSIVQGAGFSFPPDFYYIGRSFYIMFENFGLIILLPLFIIRSFRSLRIKDLSAVLILFTLGLPIVQGFVAPQFRHFGRYIFPVIPLVALIVIAKLRDFMLSEDGAPFFRTMKDSKRTIVLGLIITACSLPLAIKWAGVYADSVRNINDQHLAVAQWVQEHEISNIAADDVGALGYVAKKNIIDLTGLISPEFYPLQKDQSLVWKEARNQGARYFIIYPRLNPDFYRYAKDSLELVKNFPVRLPLVSSADTVMSVFKVRGS
jgi:hypothetical protein